jgi:hypothetical protein
MQENERRVSTANQTLSEEWFRFEIQRFAYFVCPSTSNFPKESARQRCMTPEVKAHYERLSKEDKERQRGSLYNKFTSDGRPILQVLQQETEDQFFRYNMNCLVRTTVIFGLTERTSILK